MRAGSYKVVVTLKRLPCDVCRIIVPLPKSIPLDDPVVAGLMLDLLMVVPDKGFLIARDGRLIGLGFSDKKAADLFFEWVDRVVGGCP